MTSTYYFEYLKDEVKSDRKIKTVLEYIEAYATENKSQIYVIDQPIGERKYNYLYEKALIVLVPKVKLLILNFDEDTEEFDDFVDDFIYDLGIISDKYDYNEFLGRTRKWKDNLIEVLNFKDNPAEELKNIIELNTLEHSC